MRWIKAMAVWGAACLALGVVAMGVGAGAGLLIGWLVGPAGLSVGQAVLVTAVAGLVLAGAIGGLACEAFRE